MITTIVSYALLPEWVQKKLCEKTVQAGKTEIQLTGTIYAKLTPDGKNIELWSTTGQIIHPNDL